MEWYLKVLQNFLVFSGRARRKEYWMFILINFGITLTLGFAESMVGMPGTLSSFYALVVLIPTVAVAVRRLHDTGRSGWWMLLNFLPVLGSLVLLVFFVFDGEEGMNEYGPNPKAGEGYQMTGNQNIIVLNEDESVLKSCLAPKMHNLSNQILAFVISGMRFTGEQKLDGIF